MNQASTTDDSLSAGQIALQLLRSAEYSQNQGVQFDALDNAGQVEQFYQGILGRTADAEGKANWLVMLEQGMSLDEIADHFTGASELTGQYLAANEWDFLV
ncbi:MAG: DUF4214 domain-containing protein [Marinobacterium sp.]|nr:DUF4214 domain-containing protein [Marinobacterium sp.]